MRVCVCKVMQERKGGRKGGGTNAGVRWSKYTDQLSCDHFEPLLHPATSPSSIPSLDHHPPLPLLAAAPAVSDRVVGWFSLAQQRTAWLQVSDFECRVEIPCFQTLTRNGKSEHPQTKTPTAIYRSPLNSPDSGSAGDWHFFFFFLLATFQKKQKINLKKAESQKKRNSSEKWMTDIPDRQIDT